MDLRYLTPVYYSAIIISSIIVIIIITTTTHRLCPSQCELERQSLIVFCDDE